ncbi:histidine kinase [Actinoplanes sp. NPDC049265]|uniref:sensor histidine kinase n=1 Tax=Actinoplanes sp. NPDC049265 TaxID=3363902 RepID=UPI0037225809
MTDDDRVSYDATAASEPAGPAPAGRLAEAGRRLREWDGRHRWVLDTLVVAGLLVLFGVPGLFDDRGPSDAPIPLTEGPLPWMLLLQSALILPLWWRRRAPYAAFCAVLAVFMAQWAAGVMLRADVAVLVALYSLVLHGRLRRLPWAAPWVIPAIVLVVVRLSGIVPVWDVLFFAFTNGTAAIALGLAVRIRRAQLVALRDRAVRLEIERDTRSRLAAATERARVAREMHDIVGHSLAVIVSLADGGEYAASADPERGMEALRLIGATGRSSLAELRRMLGVLREQTSEPDLSPQPGVDALDQLCRQVRAAGPRVEYQSTGALHTLDVGAQLAAYRIVQEALTNALKHAGPHTHIHLALRLDGDRLRIRVRDTGPPAGRPPVATAGEGLGLVGMKERAGLYAGTVSAGPAPDGGWVVQADLGVEGDPA